MTEKQHSYTESYSAHGCGALIADGDQCGLPIGDFAHVESSAFWKGEADRFEAELAGIKAKAHALGDSESMGTESPMTEHISTAECRSTGECSICDKQMDMIGIGLWECENGHIWDEVG